jgi:hypothetical protein
VEVIALLCAGAWAQGVGFASVGTGIRPLGLSGFEALTGGGARLGVDLGAVAPFVGASVFLASVSPADDEISLAGSSISGQLGARLEADGREARAFPFATAGVILSRERGSVEFEDDDLVSAAGWESLPGLFGGAGGEAAITPRVGIGLEIGMAALFGQYVESEYSPSGRTPSDYHAEAKLRSLFTYGDLHVTFRLGGDR